MEKTRHHRSHSPKISLTILLIPSCYGGASQDRRLGCQGEKGQGGSCGFHDDDGWLVDGGHQRLVPAMLDYDSGGGIRAEAAAAAAAAEAAAGLYGCSRKPTVVRRTLATAPSYKEQS